MRLIRILIILILIKELKLNYSKHENLTQDGDLTWVRFLTHRWLSLLVCLPAALA